MLERRQPEHPDRQRHDPQDRGRLVDRDRVGGVGRAVEERLPVLRTGLHRGRVERVRPAVRRQVHQVERAGGDQQREERRSLPPCRVLAPAHQTASERTEARAGRPGRRASVVQRHRRRHGAHRRTAVTSSSPATAAKRVVRSDTGSVAPTRSSAGPGVDVRRLRPEHPDAQEHEAQDGRDEVRGRQDEQLGLRAGRGSHGVQHDERPGGEHPGEHEDHQPLQLVASHARRSRAPRT